MSTASAPPAEEPRATLGGGAATGPIPILIALIGLWTPAAINRSGVENSAAVRLWTAIPAFVLLVLMSTVGLFSVQAEGMGTR